MNTCRECKYSAIDGGSTSHIRCLASHNEVADIRNGLIGDCQAFEQKESSASPTLLPCPFCGGPAEIWSAHQDPKLPAWIACMGRCCVLVSKEYETTDEAVHAWNTRHNPGSPPPESELPFMA